MTDHAAAEKVENAATGKPPIEKVLEKRRALGRGLEALLPPASRVAGLNVPRSSAAVEPQARPERIEDPLPHGPGLGEDARRSIESFDLHAQAVQRDAVLHIPLGSIDKNPYQTRQIIRESYLHELADSIRTNGVLQPVIVRPGADGRFSLIAGECRWRASKLAEKATIPALVREVSNQQALEMTIIENLQRQDLNCWEQAQAFGRLSREFQLTQEEIARRTGLERSSVANYMRLLKLPEEVQEMLREGKLEFGQAKLLMSIEGREQLVIFARRAANLGMSVRELQDWIHRTENPPERPEPKRKDPNVLAAQNQLEHALGVRVRISDRNGKGHITIEYKSLEDFERVLEMLSKE